MLQEMKLEDALKKFLKGRKVLVLYNEVTSTDKPVYGIEPLREMLEGMQFLVDVPAIEELELKQEVEQMVKTEKSSDKAVKKKLVDLPKNKSKLDDYQEEIIQMLKDGKSQYAIAKELGVVQSTIAHWMARHGVKWEICHGSGNLVYLEPWREKRNCGSGWINHTVSSCGLYEKNDPEALKRCIRGW